MPTDTEQPFGGQNCDLREFTARFSGVLDVAGVQAVTPGDVNRSYLIFRLTGEGDLIPGGSSGFMPLGGSKLNNSQMCQAIG